MPSPSDWEFIRLYRFYQDKIFPFSGGLFDQPNIYIEAMEHINAVMADRGKHG